MEKLVKEKLEELKKNIFEVKTYDHSHGKKMPKSVLSNWFRTVAPRLKNLQQVKTSLAALYRQNNVEADEQVISSIITSYSKRVNLSAQKQQKAVQQNQKVAESVQLDEEALSKDEQDKKEQYVKSMKKHFKDFVKRYGKDAKSVIYATATKNAKE